jgi:Protein of unknown function (DUF3043)
VFRRTKPEDSAAETPAAKDGGKGRPTPTRKEAEAAARAKAKGPQNKKDAARLLKTRRAEQNAKVREGMKTGDERLLPARDKGRVKRFTRDLVDARLCAAEFLLPMLLVILILSRSSPTTSNDLWFATILLLAVDTIVLRLKLRRELSRRFPDESTKGVFRYALVRSLQVRFLRLPKAQVKLGHKLGDRY